MWPDTRSGQDVAGGPGLGQSFAPVPLDWLAGTDGAYPSGDIRPEQKPHRTGAAGRGLEGAGGWREPGAAGAGAGGATHAGGGLAARCSPAPRSLKASFSRSAGSSPEEAGAT